MLLFGVPSCFRPVTTMLLFGVLLSICLVYAIMLLFGVCYHAIRCTLSCFYLVYAIMLLFGVQNHAFIWCTKSCFYLVYTIMFLWCTKSCFYGVRNHAFIWCMVLIICFDLTIYWDMSPMLRGALSSESTTALLAFCYFILTNRFK